jgi:dinuclear metal center YbgI/SA1388 family protein
MQTVNELTSFLHTIAPNHLQEDYDNAGLITGHGSQVITGVLVSLDCTEEIIDEALSLSCNVVVCHHPIVFRGMKRFNGNTYVERVIIKAIKKDIAIFAIHTNLDNVALNGVNEMICKKLGLEKTKILRPKDASDPNIGAGMIGYLKNGISYINFLQYVKERMDLKVVKHTKPLTGTVEKVAVCGGSGIFLLGEAINQGAQAFITADVKYHEFFDAENELILLDIGHFESERYTIDLLFSLISMKFTTFATHYTKVNTNPIDYYP